MRRLTIVLVVGLVLMCVHTLWGAKVVRKWTAFRQEDGLAHNLVTSVVQTQDGAIWFATLGGGISRYDGQRWRTFRSEDGLPGNAFETLHEAQDGTLWTAAAGGFEDASRQRIARLVGDRWEVAKVPEDLGRARVQHIIGVGGGGLCFATDGGGILHYDGTRWQAITSKEGLASENIRCMLRSGDGMIWAAHGTGRRGRGRGFPIGGPRPPGAGMAGGVSRLDPETGRWARFSEEDELPGRAVLAMEQAAGGSVWFGMANGGVSHTDGRGWRTFTTADGLPSNRVQVIRSAPDGSVWIGTPSGVACYTPPENPDHEKGTWQVFTEEDGLPNNFVTSIWVARDASVWVGTWGGAARYGRTGWVHHDTWEGLEDRGGVVLEQDADGVLWAATGEGIYRLEGCMWTRAYRFTTPQGRAVDLRMSAGRVLWGATFRSIFRFHNSSWEEIEIPDDGPQNPFLSIFPARGGGLWVGTPSGAYRFDGVDWTPHPLKAAGDVLAICETNDAAVWFGLGEGVIREVDGKQEHFTDTDGMPGGEVIAVAQAQNGDVWISTRLGGVARYDGKQWTPVPHRKGTIFNGVRRIYQADDGTFWLASRIDGAIRTDGTAWMRYTVRGGLPGSRVWDIGQDDKGQFWFATDRGLGCYASDGFAPETALVSPPVEVAPFRSALFRFSAQDAWKQTQTLQYSWRLDRGPWAPFSQEDRVLFGRLGFGPHRLEVRAMDREFEVDPTPAVHRFTVLAPVWRQSWFLGLSVLVLMALTISSGYALQRHRRWREAQARLIEEMDSELRQAHDLQMGLLPTQPIQTERIEIAGRCVPANHVGGDYFSYFWLDEEEQVLGFGAADVSGKAMDGAVRAMQLSGMFRYEFRPGRAPVEVLQGLHEVLKKELPITSFITCGLGVLNVREGCVRLANAAHPFPFHYSAATGELEAPEMPSLPMGIQLPPGASGGFAQAEIEMGPGDLLVLYSDGVTDMQNEAGTFYEEGRLEAVLRRCVGLGAEAVVETVLEDLKQFKGKAAQPDDITLLVLKLV